VGAAFGHLLLSGAASPTLPFLPGLVHYLRTHRPEVLYSKTPYLNIEAAWAKKLSGVPLRLVVSEHNNLSHGHPFGNGWRGWWLTRALRRSYGSSDRFVAVSAGVADDMAQRTGISRAAITVIHNPALPTDLELRMEAPLTHPWFGPQQPPIILGVGRLGRAKDFPTLLRAFARVRGVRRARLVILGSLADERKTAKRQSELMSLAHGLGIAADVALPGFVANPLPYMRKASVFVLSSLYEGFGNVLVEAMACGCPVVSTDCPSGPAEILNGGEFGPLVAARDDVAMAKAIVSVLSAPPAAKKLKARAAVFSIDRALPSYQRVLFGPMAQRI
jgi:glycosyltransferase involved in cell wall biosynthesis